MPFSLAIPKFVGTISLGLLTGLSYTLGVTTYPALLLLPTPQAASRTYSAISLRAQAHAIALAGLALTAFGTAFALAPARARHPYLLWTAGLAGLGVAPDVVRVIRSGTLGGPSTMDEPLINGEMVEERVRRAGRREAVKGVVAGVAFAMGVVGLWGDGA